MSRIPAFTDHDHDGCTRAAMDHAETLAAERGLRLTPVRRRTLEILLAEHRAMGAYEVLEKLAASGFGAQPPVAYRALEFLVENGLAHRIQLLNAFAACAHPGRQHAPVFFICEGCGAMAEAPDRAIRAEIDSAAGGLGFTVRRAGVEAVGLCPACGDAP